jgi:Sec-independent protein secretion pathway component TatC
MVILALFMYGLFEASLVVVRAMQRRSRRSTDGDG